MNKKPDVLSEEADRIRAMLSNTYGSPFRPASQAIIEDLITEICKFIQQATDTVQWLESFESKYLSKPEKGDKNGS